MGDLNHVTSERSLIPEDAPALSTLCIFSDASKKAFGACAYFTWRTESNEYVTRFIAAKSRVAPLKPLTIPRLELQAAVLPTRLSQSIHSRRVKNAIWESRILLRQQHRIITDLQSSERVQTVRVRPSSRDSKQFWSLSKETCPWRSKRCWWHLPWYTGTTTKW